MTKNLPLWISSLCLVFIAGLFASRAFNPPVEQYEIIPTVNSSDTQDQLQSYLSREAANGWKVRATMELNYGGTMQAAVIMAK